MQKTFTVIGMIIGSTLGGYAPMLFGAGLFSVSSIITSALGGFLGIYFGYKLGQYY
ncbi:MAG TPA: hypothetical protein VJK26_02490 [Patescibacteria group bacterium]|nr:hypothetical protein [Patescibacteria group bacterium]